MSGTGGRRWAKNHIVVRNKNKKTVCSSELLKVIKVRVNSFFETCPLLSSSVAALDSLASLLQ